MSESLGIFTAITPLMRPMRGLLDSNYTLSANYRVSMVGPPGKAQRPRSMTGDNNASDYCGARWRARKIPGRAPSFCIVSATTVAGTSWIWMSRRYYHRHRHPKIVALLKESRSPFRCGTLPS